jgi:hypothetical protein
MTSWVTLIFWHWHIGGKYNVVKIDIYYDFQSFFNEHEYKYAVDVMSDTCMF